MQGHNGIGCGIGHNRAAAEDNPREIAAAQRPD
jgi:hypothetical protein